MSGMVEYFGEVVKVHISLLTFSNGCYYHIADFNELWSPTASYQNSMLKIGKDNLIGENCC